MSLALGDIKNQLLEHLTAIAAKAPGSVVVVIATHCDLAEAAGELDDKTNQVSDHIQALLEEMNQHHNRAINRQAQASPSTEPRLRLEGQVFRVASAAAPSGRQGFAELCAFFISLVTDKRKFPGFMQPIPSIYAAARGFLMSVRGGNEDPDQIAEQVLQYLSNPGNTQAQVEGEGGGGGGGHGGLSRGAEEKQEVIHSTDPLSAAAPPPSPLAEQQQHQPKPCFIISKANLESHWQALLKHPRMSKDWSEIGFWKRVTGIREPRFKDDAHSSALNDALCVPGRRRAHRMEPKH